LARFAIDECVEKDHRIDRIERPVLPFPHLVEDPG
jgi:hypothetical protein